MLSYLLLGYSDADVIRGSGATSMFLVYSSHNWLNQTLRQVYEEETKGASGHHIHLASFKG
jgi:hypothetical protein